MRKSRITLAGMCLTTAALIITGCSTSSGAASGAGAYKVYALLPQGTDQPYGTSYVQAMKQEAKNRNIDLTITNSQYDADTQASDCEVAVAAKPDLIILWPAVADTVRPCLTRAKDAGIPITITNSDVKPEDKDLATAYSGPDTYGQGAASAGVMCRLASGKPTNIVMVDGLTGNFTAFSRRAGFVDTVAKDCPNVKILAEQPGDWDKGTSQTVTSEMVTSVGAQNVQGIFAADDTMVAGAIAALKSQGIDPKPLYITSIGGTKLGNPLLESGDLDSTVYQSSSWDGRNAVVLADQVLTGQPFEKNLFMPTVVVTKSNAHDPNVTPEW